MHLIETYRPVSTSEVRLGADRSLHICLCPAYLYLRWCLSTMMMAYCADQVYLGESSAYANYCRHEVLAIDVGMGVSSARFNSP